MIICNFRVVCIGFVFGNFDSRCMNFNPSSNSESCFVELYSLAFKLVGVLNVFFLCRLFHQTWITKLLMRFLCNWIWTRTVVSIYRLEWSRLVGQIVENFGWTTFFQSKSQFSSFTCLNVRQAICWRPRFDRDWWCWFVDQYYWSVHTQCLWQKGSPICELYNINQIYSKPWNQLKRYIIIQI